MHGHHTSRLKASSGSGIVIYEANMLTKLSGCVSMLGETAYPVVRNKLIYQNTHGKGAWLIAGTDYKTDSRMDWINFIENFYLTIVGLFCRYDSDNNANNVVTFSILGNS